MIVFGTRGSRLARAQTEMVARTLAQRTGESWRVEVISTRGDRILEQPLPEIGGKGVFTAELEEALRTGRIDVAVHSFKDLPVEDPEGLVVGAVPPRADPRDVLVLRAGEVAARAPLEALGKGARVGTSSPRRRGALLATRDDLICVDLRGNVPTRIEKLRAGRYDAIVLAAAGLERLGLDLQGLAVAPLPVERFTPAPAQGALAVQCRGEDDRVRALLEVLHDEESARCARAERALLARLGGGCSMPFGALLEPGDDGDWRLRATLYGETPRAAAFSREEIGADPDELIARAVAALRPLVGAPLLGRRILMPRPGGEGGALAEALAVAGASVEVVAWTEIEDLRVGDAAAAAARDARVVAFTSARAVDRFFAAGNGHAWSDVRFFAVGPATAQALARRGVACEVPSEPRGGEALGRWIAERCPRGTVVLHPCAQDRTGGLERTLARAGLEPRPLPLYRTRKVDRPVLPDGSFDAVVLGSPSSARALREAAGRWDAPCVCIGPTTAESGRGLGLRVAAVAEAPDPSSLVSALQEALR